MPQPVHHKSFSWGVSYSYTYNLVNFHWQSAILFDPATQRTGDAILHGLGVGDRIQLGAFVISYYLRVDLTVSIGFGSAGFSFPSICLTLTKALGIPGVNGFYTQINFCFGGGTIGFQSGGVSSMQMTGGPCAQVTQQGPPLDSTGRSSARWSRRPAVRNRSASRRWGTPLPGRPWPEFHRQHSECRSDDSRRHVQQQLLGHDSAAGEQHDSHRLRQ